MGRKLIAAALLATLPMASANAACLTPKQAKSLMLVLAPPLLAGLPPKCSGTDFRFVDDMARRYRIDADAAWPDALAAMQALGVGELPSDLDAALREAIGDKLKEQVLDQFKPEMCAGVATLLRPLASLPPSDFANVIVGMLMLAPDSEEAGFTMCKGTDVTR